ncbi:glycosyltransferase family 4 protein [Bradyrhizobium elkanii]|uniref:glycosyltransferase family 4 protein n=1 Tax=Bradyrhizobium elkanii TaxID=29448 RepID=UPI00036F38D6|nr:glycosyltransferase family 4 protein [Bradyrhizobium elkanii]MCP1729880.1 glycosyltransferase involved in cell wall biosynthesis [Bradyrhizobium elkanii]MCS3574009.1 glycosyltransferase involved in cell wall biosynthesis [Bradyrhizobium elkanii]MCS3593300.1 glycosyltransferase involved in cell wall biosynthesis [Bradyrhizobium elkanii]MCS3622745.1 glycosyltransferase involved in cell wall biosynthesis [Bradyrhizobium elkanii]MCW2108788.1 glycosyltransferase involved in cell wall biosynthesi
MSRAEPSPRRILIIVENLPVPFDRRVWCEATSLRKAGYEVSVICPKGRGHDESYECLEGIHIYRHPMPVEARGIAAYLIEYPVALFWETLLAIKVAWKHGFDVIQGCNPPDLIFLIGLLFKLGGKRFVFDHHDVNPELYEAKFGRRDFFWQLLRLVEYLTFKTASISIATNESYREIAIARGGMPANRVFVVRSGPNLDRVRSRPADPAWRRGRRYSVGYVGVIGQSEGIDLLLQSIGHIVHDLGRTDIQFNIAGTGPEWNAVVKLCEEMQLSDYVNFTGAIADDALFTMLSTADVCVNPDRVTPMNDISTMNKIMEYMALGRPIVQFDVREGRRSALDASLYAAKNDPRDFASKIITLIDDPSLRQSMGAFGRNRVERALSWTHEEPKLLAAYESLFAGTVPAQSRAPRAHAPAERPTSEPSSANAAAGRASS